MSLDDIINSMSSSNMDYNPEEDKRCAPTLNYEAGSCIRLQILVEMANAYNEEVGENSSDTISLDSKVEILNPKKYKKYLVKQLNKRIGSKCTNQKCWTSQHFVKKIKNAYKVELEKYTWRAEGPQGRFEWLNTLHIEDVMEQYEAKYKDFKFLGAVPIDFDDFERFGIKNLDFAKLISDGVTKLGVIFNLDKHNESGSHWVASYADISSGKIYFFDSYGLPPAPQIRKYMRRLEAFCSNHMKIKNVVIDYNKEQHQKENSECGVYSLNFIIRLLGGGDFKKIEREKMSDKEVNKCRKIYFRNTKF